MRYWDASALVPLIVAEQGRTRAARTPGGGCPKITASSPGRGLEPRSSAQSNGEPEKVVSHVSIGATCSAGLSPLPRRGTRSRTCLRCGPVQRRCWQDIRCGRRMQVSWVRRCSLTSKLRSPLSLCASTRDLPPLRSSKGCCHLQMIRRCSGPHISRRPNSARLITTF